MPRRSRPNPIAAACALALLGGPAAAVVTAGGGNPGMPSGLDLAGVGALSNGCSTVLLAGGEWLLGAAHCAAGPGATVSFSNGATASITELVLAPDWLPGQQVGVNDLSLMRLAVPPVGVEGFTIASPPAAGTAVVVAGFGAGGSGASGATLPAGTLRYGFNQYEIVLSDSATAPYGGRVFGFDFDDGSAALNRFGSSGLGSGEAMLAGLDSGGPSFVLEQGIWKVAGIHVGIAEDLGSGFGGIGFDLQAGYYSAWIGQVTAVPESRADLLLLVGVATAGWSLRRRRHAEGDRTRG